MKTLRALFAVSTIVLPLLLPALRAAPDTVMPVFKPGATILFVGDSITDGGRAKKTPTTTTPWASPLKRDGAR